MSRFYRLAALGLAAGLLGAMVSGCALLRGGGATTPPGTVTVTVTDTSTPDLSAVFAQLTDSFTFASGAGGWSTTVKIAADGSFAGQYNDTDMGDTGPGYPNGTRYICLFSGHFMVTAQVDQYEYALELVDISQQGTPDDTTIESDGYRYIVSTPYGFDDAQAFSLYAPGHPVSSLPGGFVDWLRQPQMLPDDATTLPFWGLYNIAGDDGFFG